MINENLKSLRKINQYTQEELAEKLNVSRQSIAKWESGGSLR
ncbi:helix-turn-helix family protein [Clostridioides difficile 824]|nr:helix-turn-helix transcriptional regulator [Clostridioides difficile]EQF87257.1 helix-turn-helix family protein [Clostridioides difficile 824]VIF22884.1 AbrB family transcriptional regulator [Clostridioides difficile]